MIDFILTEIDRILGSYGTRVVVLLFIAVVLPIGLGVIARVFFYRHDAEESAMPSRSKASLVTAMDVHDEPAGTESATDPQPSYEWSTGNRDFAQVRILVAGGETTARADGDDQTPAPAV